MKLKVVYWKLREGDIAWKITVENNEDFPTSNIFCENDNRATVDIVWMEKGCDHVTQGYSPDSAEAILDVNLIVKAIATYLAEWRGLVTPKDLDLIL